MSVEQLMPFTALSMSVYCVSKLIHALLVVFTKLQLLMLITV